MNTAYARPMAVDNAGTTSTQMIVLRMTTQFWSCVKIHT